MIEWLNWTEDEEEKTDCKKTSGKALKMGGVRWWIKALLESAAVEKRQNLRDLLKGWIRKIAKICSSLFFTYCAYPFSRTVLNPWTTLNARYYYHHFWVRPPQVSSLGLHLSIRPPGGTIVMCIDVPTGLRGRERNTRRSCLVNPSMLRPSYLIHRFLCGTKKDHICRESGLLIGPMHSRHKAEM